MQYSQLNVLTQLHNVGLKVTSHFARLCFLILFAIGQHGMAADNLKNAIISDGKIYADFRYRYEHVDDGLAPKDANASTLRSVLGYQSGKLHGFSALLEGELVNRLGGNFTEFPGQSGSNTALVADPDSTELNQGYLQYQAIGNNRIRIGRQIITYRDEPFHRFIGTILWRQNWQTFDAISLKNQVLAHTTLSYAYIWNVNRIFGDQSPPPLSDFDSDSHLLNVQYDRFSFANLESYAYLLDFDNASAASNATLGLRVHGDIPLYTAIIPIYALEYAHQSDHGDNPGNYDVSYQLVESGFRFKPDNILDSLMLKVSYERLSGTGTFAFQTPLGTNHAFQGTADRFLTTPADGIRDYYVTGVATAWGFKLTAGYHVLESDKLGYRYGDELDIELTRGIGRYLTLGAKYADYNADGNVTSFLRNGISTVTADARKFWLYATASF